MSEQRMLQPESKRSAVQIGGTGTKTILAIDKDPDALREMVRQLAPHGYRVLTAVDSRRALEVAGKNPVDLAVISDQRNGDNGLLLMDTLRGLQQGLPALILTAHGSIDRAVVAMKQGACHYLTKPFAEEELLRQIDNCLQQRRAVSGVRSPPGRPEPEAPPSCARIIAKSKEMKAVLAKITQIASTDSNVYIEGESGSGKELVARCLHGASRRKDGPFIAVNCAAIPENLLESELLGYEKGAFTGADGRREGLFAQAHGGSFFLDELSELPFSMQAKLLRILEEREFYPLGGNRKVTVDVRIIAASNQELEKLMHEGRFREDLYYRIRVIPIVLPPLRKRKEDILPLAEHFLAKFSHEMGKSVTKIAPAAARKLLTADWPGNVRELENMVEYAVAMAEGEVVTPEVIAGSTIEMDGTPPLRGAKDDFEKDYLTNLLERYRGNVSQAARAAGKYRADFYSLLKKHGLTPSDFRES